MRYLTEYCGFSPAVAQSCAQQWVQEIETPPYLRMDHIYGDAHGILSELYGKGFTLALISARQREDYLLCQVREMGLSAFFHTISCVTPEAAFEEKLRALPLTNKNARTFSRFFVAGATSCELDKQGRILVPATLREFAGLEKDVVLTGNINRIEIWSKEKWNENSNYDDMDAIAESMEEMGIVI